LTVHQFCSMLPSFVFDARPLVPVEYPTRCYFELTARRGSIKGKSQRREIRITCLIDEKQVQWRCGRCTRRSSWKRVRWKGKTL